LVMLLGINFIIIIIVLFKIVFFESYLANTYLSSLK